MNFQQADKTDFASFSLSLSFCLSHSLRIVRKACWLLNVCINTIFCFILMVSHKKVIANFYECCSFFFHSSISFSPIRFEKKSKNRFAEAPVASDILLQTYTRFALLYLEFGWRHSTRIGPKNNSISIMQLSTARESKKKTARLTWKLAAFFLSLYILNAIKWLTFWGPNSKVSDNVIYK